MKFIPHIQKHTTKQVIKASSSSFFSSFFSLTPAKKQAMHTLYAFCRLFDDSCDSFILTSAQRLEAVLYWEKELKLALQNQIAHPLCIEFAKLAHDFHFDLDWMFQLVAACKSDCTSVELQSEAELYTYMYQVAVVVGLMTLKIVAPDFCSAKELAFELGSALQLTNILRDVREDYLNDRIYLPQLKLLLNTQTPTCEYLQFYKHYQERAENHFKKAMPLLQNEPDLKAPRIMALTYKQLLIKLNPQFAFYKKQKLNLFDKCKIFYVVITT